MSIGGRVGLTWRFAIAAAVVFLGLGIFLTQRLGSFTADSMVANEEEHARDLIAPQVRNFLSPGDFEAAVTAEPLESLDRFVRSSILSAHVDQVTVWDTRGRVLYSSNAGSIGKTFPPSKALLAAVAGRSMAETVRPTADSHVDEGRLGKHFEIYAPIQFPGALLPAGVLELNTPYSAIADEIGSEQERTALTLTGGLGALYLVLVGIVYGGSRRIRRQNAQLEQGLRVQARQEEERDRLVAILESTPDAVGIVDREGQPLYLNRTAREAFASAGASDASSITVFGLYPPWAAEIITGEGIPAAISQGAWSGETAVFGPDGQERPVSQVIIAHGAGDGEVEYFSSIMRDTSAQKQVEQALRRSEDSFRQLFAANPQALMVHDLAGQMLEVNDAMLRAYGHTRDEFLALNVSSIFPPAERVRFDAYLASRDPALPADAGEWRSVRKDGGEFWMHARAQALHFGGRQARLVLIEDVSARKQAEDEVMRLVAILDATTDFVATAGMDGQVMYANEALRALLEAPGSDTTEGSSVLTIAEGHPPWARELVLNTAIPAALREGSWRGETALLAGDGREVPVSQVILAHNADGNGSPYLSTIMRDVSATRQAEATLQRREEDFRLLFEANPQAMWLFDPVTFRFLAVNQAAVRQYGYSPAEFLVMSESDIRSPEEEKALATHLAAGSEDAAEWRHLRKDGAAIWVRLHVHPVEFGGRQALLVVADDMTERKQMEAQFLQAQKMEGIGRLAGGIAHDFNNLLTAIVGYAELAQVSLPDASPIRADIQQVVSAANRARDLTRQLLAFARRQVMQPKIVNLNDLVLDTQMLLRRLIGEDIELTALPDPALGFTRIDPGQLEQILVNLAVNARDAMPSGGELRIETANVTVGAGRLGYPADTTPGDYVRLTVADTGTGMSEATLAHVFEPFFTTKEPDKGTGLGLATCYGIVHQAGGQITVASVPGEGTSFNVYLPRVDALLVVASGERSGDEIRGGPEGILLVEDDPVLRTLAGRALRAEGYRVVLAANGLEALDRLAQSGIEVDLVVTDVVMPQMSGLQLVERVLAEHGGTRVLLVSGYSDDLVTGETVQSGEVAFLQKPFAMTELAQKIREVLDSPHPAAGGPWSEAPS